MREFFLGIVEITLGMSLLIPLMLLILKLVGGKFTSKCRYILWTLVLLRLAVPFSFSMLPALIEVPVEPEPILAQSEHQANIPTVEYTPPQISQEYVPLPLEPAETTVTAPVLQEPEAEPITWEQVLDIVSLIYIVGAGAFLVWNFSSYAAYVRRILKVTREPDARTKEIYEAICRKNGLAKPPVLLVSEEVNSPAAFGIIRRKIVLPDIELTDNGLAGTLSHEVTHCRRGDLYIKLLSLLARSLHWFNPFSHIAAFRCEMEMELSCDEAVLAGCDDEARAAYGEVMLDIIRRCRRNRGALTTHFNPKKNAVMARFSNILYGSGKRRGRALIAMCLVLCVLAGTVVACRVEDDAEESEESDVPMITAPLPEGEQMEIPLIYTPYTVEESSDTLAEEISQDDIAEILQEKTVENVRIILYKDENELFCAAYEKDGRLYRFIRTGGAVPADYGIEEFENILGADGFSVAWNWSHYFKNYYTLDGGEPKRILSLGDRAIEADFDSDGMTEVISQAMTYMYIYDCKDGMIQEVDFDSELLKPKAGEFSRYLPEKNQFEFDYKKDGDNTLYHRYGVVKDGVLTLVTPNEKAEDNTTSSLVNILSQNSDLQVHTVYIPVEGQNPYYHTYRMDDRYTIYQTYDRGERWDDERIAENITLWVVDALTGTIAAHYPIGREELLHEISYTDTGCVLYDWENRNGTIVVQYALRIDNNNGVITIAETDTEAYPQRLYDVRTPDGTTAAYRTVEDMDGNHGIDVKYSDGTVKRILTGEIGSVQSTIGYTPIAFLDNSHLVYSVTGGEYYVSCGIYNIDTHENIEIDGAYRCLGVADGILYTAYENSGDFNYGIYESQLWAIHTDGTKTMLAATHNIPDGITALSMEEYYLFKNGMWVFYETGDIGGHSDGDASRVMLKVRLTSPDLQKTYIEVEYPNVGDSLASLMTYGDSVTIAVPVSEKESAHTGTYPTMEAYVSDRMAQETTASYYAASKNGNSNIDDWTDTANVTDTKLVRLEKMGEVVGLSADGVLECWEYKYLLQLDVPTEEVVLVGGQEEEDGYFDLEGQNGHTTVALRREDGTYIVLMDEMKGDGLDFTGYRNSYEEAIYDWYVTEYGLNLPLYVEEWGKLITPPEGETIGNTPVHRFDGDGWGVYIPEQVWFQSDDAMENRWIWRSSYNTGSTCIVDVFSFSLEDEYVTAEEQGYTPTDRTNRVWELHKDGVHSYYYYYENPNGGFWRVNIEWTDEGITDYPYIAIEPQLLQLMAEKFVVFSVADSDAKAVSVTSAIYLCDDVYRTDNTPTHGIAEVTIPTALTDYELQDCQILLCGDGCDPTDVVSRAVWGYGPAWRIDQYEEYTSADGWNYPTRRYINEVPEDIREQMRQQGAPEYMMYPREYLYLVTLDAEHYAFIEIEPKDLNAEKPDDEVELVNEFIKNLTIIMEIPVTEEELAEEVIMPVEEIAEDGTVVQESEQTGLITEEPTQITREDWIEYKLKTDFGFREPVDVTALTDEELEAYMADAYTAARKIYSLYYIESDGMYGRRFWSSEMPVVTIDNRPYSQMFNPVFPTLADWESYMRGILSDELTDSLLATDMFIDYEGELWGIMGARGTDISKKTVGYSVTSRTDTEIIYTAEVEIREMDLSAEEPESVEYYDFTYALTEDGWRWTDFYVYN